MIASKQNRIDLSFFVGSVVGRCHGLMGWGGGVLLPISPTFRTRCFAYTLGATKSEWTDFTVQA